MDKYKFSVIFLFCLSSLFAQTGMHNIYYDNNLLDTKSKAKEIGISEERLNGILKSEYGLGCRFLRLAFNIPCNYLPN